MSMARDKKYKPSEKALFLRYIRYNDDFLLLGHDRALILKAKALIGKMLAEKGLTLTDKAGVFKAENGFYFLRKRFIMRPSGKIILRLHPKALSEERKQLRNLCDLVRAGRRSMADVQAHYQSWVASAEYAGDAPIAAMDRYYKQLFRLKPVYKRKRRHLYGQDPNRPQRARKAARA